VAAARPLDIEPWKSATAIKVNPDSPQRPLRAEALRCGITNKSPRSPRLAGDRARETLLANSPTEYSNRNDSAASTEDRNERYRPHRVAEECRSNRHTHRHNKHNCSWNEGN
jgi:hypothetical protein